MTQPENNNKIVLITNKFFQKYFLTFIMIFLFVETDGSG